MALKKFIDFTASIKAQSGVSQSTFSPSTTAENRFVPQYLTAKFAGAYSTITGGGGTAVAAQERQADDQRERRGSGRARQPRSGRLPQQGVFRRGHVRGDLEERGRLQDGLHGPDPAGHAHRRQEHRRDDRQLDQSGARHRPAEGHVPGARTSVQSEGPRLSDREVQGRLFGRRYDDDQGDADERGRVTKLL